jgi:hypothetical protein
MSKYAILTFLTTILNASLLHAQSTTNVSGNTIYTPYNGSIAYSIGEQFYIQKGTIYHISEGIQNGIAINPIQDKNNIHVSIYPNPTSEIINFKVQDYNFYPIAYKIYNNTGQELINGRIIHYNTSVSLKQLPASIYIVKLFNDREEIMTYQIIKIN